MDKKLKGKPGENRRRKATELPRHPGRNVSGAARFDGRDGLVCSFLILLMQWGSRNASNKYQWGAPVAFSGEVGGGGAAVAVGHKLYLSTSLGYLLPLASGDFGVVNLITPRILVVMTKFPVDYVVVISPKWKNLIDHQSLSER